MQLTRFTGWCQLLISGKGAVVDVLPNPDDSGQDLGVFTMANARPQTVTPRIGAALLGVGSATTQNHSLLLYAAGAAALVGALIVLPIKKVR